MADEPAPVHPRAAAEQEPQRRSSPTSFIVVGGGRRGPCRRLAALRVDSLRHEEKDKAAELLVALIAGM
jgi:hypothetical protein